MPRLRFSQEWVASTTQLRARQPGEPVRQASSVLPPTLANVMAADGQVPRSVGGEECPSGTVRPEGTERQIVRAHRAEPVSDEEIRRAIATAQDAAIRRAVAKTKQTAQRRLFLALGR